MAKYDPFIQCDKCNSIIRKSNKARHFKLKHPSGYKKRILYQKIKCFCGKSFSPNHLKNHWIKIHQQHVSLQHYKWQIKRKMIETGKSFSEYFIELNRRRKQKLTEKLKKKSFKRIKQSKLIMKKILIKTN